MADVIVFQSHTSRSRVVCDAMMRGIRHCGLDRVSLLMEHEYSGAPMSDIAVFYGASGRLREVMDDYTHANKMALYIDLGYWGRHLGGRRQGYHKVVLNGRHPTPYYRRIKHAMDRWHKFGLKIQPWKARPGGAVLVAGMSAKGSRFEGFEPMGWERAAINLIRHVTDRPIIYRPKPTCKEAMPILGVGYSPPGETLDTVLAKTAVVVSHHSNTNIEAILAGVCSFTEAGVAVDQSQTDLNKIEDFVKLKDREQWVADIAYTQWNVAEMCEGKPWTWLKNEGFI